MASSQSDPPNKVKNYERHKTNEAMQNLTAKISQIKKQIQAARSISIKENLKRNGKNVDVIISRLCEFSSSIKDLHVVNQDASGNMLSLRMETPLSKLSGYSHGSGEKDGVNNQEALPPMTVKLPHVDKIPTYTTWIFLDKNQRMPDDQSVVGRRQIYYDQDGGETLISSDSDEESPELEKVKPAFSEGEDQLVWKVLQEYGTAQEVLDVLSQFVGFSPSEIQDRYNLLGEKFQEKHSDTVGSGVDLYEKGIVLDKSLDAALDSFDNLFCRRCLVFDCRLHGCSQNLIIPSEKQPCFSEENGKPCSEQCYLLLKKQVGDINRSENTHSERCNDTRVVGNSSEAASSAEGDDGIVNESTTVISSEESSQKHKKGKVEGELGGCVWKPIEKDLCLKGIEIFGRNSCLITRNLLSGLKTCMEVHSYIFKDVNSPTFPISGLEGDEIADSNYKEQGIPSRSRFFRRRGRARKLKYTWKSSGHPSFRKRIALGKNRLEKHYTPCGCDSMCGKQCPCVDYGTCCEKYCGCSKSCKNRFRGCHCAKSQCRSRQCPCFAANRECDPDVCRNCWVSCGDGSLGEPPSRGDGYKCGNMKLLLKQQQRILLSRSSVAGWGAFIKNPVNKNDYLGEYTGETITPREADKRGKIYDRANSSYLFDLNDQNVLDAYRKGDKLKFANHSSTPNCYAKIMMVAGDHRVGIFAKERIEASEELFYDYFYGPDTAPPWARKSEGSKKNDSSAPHARARKHQSD